ncbi:hypothetical protein LF1_13990 [Rubripirellula obstinata]|uniref:Uncharacterized protein n=1 Tax=Rubripirellula obstinata TaxID=406547 RepID=A0A5B1CG23_9BACT|nr:hypothetical protein [Rubripirellula obstinata]KAA1258875.1 hypothetical protein LF1_13990 [Rubripirellula obstinata]
MNARIFSKAAHLTGGRTAIRAILASLTLCCISQVYWTSASAQAPATNSRGLFTDPQTGIVYRQVSKTVERPVIETKVVKQNQTVYRPETVTETKPENRTVYTPVVEYKWQPRMHGRWNPFQQPTVAYHHVPETRWEARNEVVNRTERRTKWIAENRTVDVSRQQVRMQREQKTELEVVGKVAPPDPSPTDASSAIAARLRPLDSNARVAPLNQSRVATTYSTPVYSAPSYSAPQIAASTIGRMTSDPPRRNSGQSGMRANDLYPTSQVHGHALPPTSGGVGIANLPSLPFMR